MDSTDPDQDPQQGVFISIYTSQQSVCDELYSLSVLDFSTPLTSSSKFDCSTESNLSTGKGKYMGKA